MFGFMLCRYLYNYVCETDEVIRIFIESIMLIFIRIIYRWCGQEGLVNLHIFLVYL